LQSRFYETTIVIDSLHKADDIKNTVGKVETFIKNNGGSIVTIEEWGKKRLAYEINRKQYGNYFHIIFDGPGTLPGLLEREFRLEESILRHLTVKTDAKKLKLDAVEEQKEEQPQASVAPSKKDGEEQAAAEDQTSVPAEQEKAETPEPVETKAETDGVTVEEEVTVEDEVTVEAAAGQEQTEEIKKEQ
jgi:small subunit ribosomal protein S6